MLDEKQVSRDNHGMAMLDEKQVSRDNHGMATRKSASIEKLTVQTNFRLSDQHRRALADLARLDEVTPSEYIRRMIDREWTARAEDIQRVTEVFAEVRKKKRAA